MCEVMEILLSNELHFKNWSLAFENHRLCLHCSTGKRVTEVPWY